MEQGTCRPLRSPHATWKSPQCSAHRLCKKAVDLCQYCRRARNPLDRNSRYDLMVATRLTQPRPTLLSSDAHLGRGRAHLRIDVPLVLDKILLEHAHQLARSLV